VSCCMRKTLIALTFAGAAFAQSEQKPLGEIDFFGQKNLNVEAIRAALPLHDGELFPPAGSSDKLKLILSERVKQVIGREATDVAFVCCDREQRWMIYIGLPGASGNPAKYNASPRGTAMFPAEALRLDKQIEDAWVAAVLSGKAGEDDSQGFTLSSEPTLRAKQMDLREYALKNEALILRVLESSDARHRRFAAQALGYARQSNAQVEALVHACLDPDDEVRNNATRALGVLLSAKPDLAPMISIDPFITLLTSGVWSDHNKAVIVLGALTNKRDQIVLNKLRSGALDNLLEMARWRSDGHAFMARVILGRIAGIEEARLNELAQNGQVDAILSELLPERPNK
jgi:hypothetical protein